MVGDWIKMRTDLYRDPKVIGMADLLMAEDGKLMRHVSQFCQRGMAITRNVTRCAVVGGLVSVWGVLRHQGTRVGDDLLIEGYTDALLDDIADVPGFGEAMCSVGWAEETDEGIVLPMFFRELNAEPIRSTAAERQRKYREKKRDKGITRDVVSDVTSRVTVTGEGEGEGEKSNTPLPPTGDGGVAPKKPRKPRQPNAEHPHFAAFWEAYPRKEAKANAVKSFASLNPDAELLALLIESIERQRRRGGCLEDRTTADGRSTIPHPASWLNGRRWEDLTPEVSRTSAPSMSSNSTPYTPYELLIPKPSTNDDH